MNTLRLRNLLSVALLLLLAGCARKEEASTPAPDPSATVVVPEKSKKDVTVCVLVRTPDSIQTRVKADGKQRVCWKGHDAAYEVRFKTAAWPFEEPADTTAGDSNVIRVEHGKASNLFTLKERLTAGQESRHPYEVWDDPATAQTPPGGPEIIGEG